MRLLPSAEAAGRVEAGGALRQGEAAGSGDWGGRRTEVADHSEQPPGLLRIRNTGSFFAAGPLE